MQVTSDEAKGLIEHTEVGLGAHHSSDIFHVQQEVVKGTSGALSGVVRQSEKQVEEATKQIRKQEKLKTAYANEPKHSPGRPPNFENKIAKAKSIQTDKEKALEIARQNQETVRKANKKISKVYRVPSVSLRDSDSLR